MTKAEFRKDQGQLTEKEKQAGTEVFHHALSVVQECGPQATIKALIGCVISITGQLIEDTDTVAQILRGAATALDEPDKVKAHFNVDPIGKPRGEC